MNLAGHLKGEVEEQLIFDRYHFDELAGKFEYDAKMSRADAEKEALKQLGATNAVCNPKATAD